MPPPEAPKFVPKTTCMAQNVPLLATLGIPWQAQQNEFVRKTSPPQSASGQGMKLNVNVSWILISKS